MNQNTARVAAEALAAVRNASAEASAAAEYMDPELHALLVTLTSVAVETTEQAIRSAGGDAATLVFWSSSDHAWKPYATEAQQHATAYIL